MNENEALPVFTKNVAKWTEKLQTHHWEQGRTWYKHAHQLCKTLSEETKLPLPNVIGVLAALSPQVSWDVNIQSCESIVRHHVIDDGYTGYTTNVAKALQCLISDPLSVLGGAKVLAFYYNILDPLTSMEVTIDTHIGRVLFDTMTLDKKQISAIFSKKGNVVAQQALQKVAKKKRVLPHVLQASLWVCVRALAQAKADKDQLPLYVK